MSEQENVAPEVEATPEPVQPETQEEGQEQPTPEQPEADAAAPEDEAAKEEKSKSQMRRERRKAQFDNAIAAEKEAKARLDRIKAAAQGEKPDRDQFEDPDEFTAALAAYQSVSAISKREEDAAQADVETAAKEAAAIRNEDWADQVNDAKSRHEDFEAVAFSAPISDEVANIIPTVENGADVAYHLGSNPAEAQRISALPATQAAIEIGRISASLSVPPPKTKTNAPPPINPVQGSGSPAPNTDKMTPQQWREFREAGGTI